MSKDDFPSTPGIYAIVNDVNQNRYVGSAKNLKQRALQHIRQLKAGNHPNIHLQRDYNIHEIDVFRFDILEHVEHVEDLMTREQHYIDSLKPQYNIAPTARSNRRIYTKEVPVTTRYPEDLHTEIKKRAQESGRSFNGQVVYELSQYQTGASQPEHQARIAEDLQTPAELKMEETWKRYSR